MSDSNKILSDRIDRHGGVADQEGVGMTDEEKQISDELDGVLINWFVWCLNYPLITGYPSRSPCFYSQEQTDADEEEAEIVDFEINQLTSEKRGVLSICTRNKYNEEEVFRSKRYSREEMHSIYLEAKAEMLERLIIRGVINK